MLKKSIFLIFCFLGLFDLTGMPTETICFDHESFNSEETWWRLLSMKEQNFPMGIATAGGSEKNLRYFLFTFL